MIENTLSFHYLHNVSLWCLQVVVSICFSVDRAPIPVVHLLLWRGREINLLLIRIQFLLYVLYWRGKGALIHCGFIIQTICRLYLGTGSVFQQAVSICKVFFFPLSLPRAILRYPVIVISPLFSYSVSQAEIARSWCHNVVLYVIFLLFVLASYLLSCFFLIEVSIIW